MSAANDKVEEKTGVDKVKHDKVGVSDFVAAAEKTTHKDLNHDGLIGGKPVHPGLIDIVEQATHPQPNTEGRIRGGSTTPH